MLKQLVMVLSIATFLSALVLAQDKPETTNKEKLECMKESSSCCAIHDSHSEMKMNDTKEAANTQAWNKVCPVKGIAIEKDSPTVEYNGKVYAFCCPGCDTKFAKNPEKYSKNLSDDGKKFVGKK